MYRIVTLVYLQYSDWLAHSINLLFLLDRKLIYEFLVLSLTKFSPNKHMACMWHVFLVRKIGDFSQNFEIKLAPMKKIIFYYLSTDLADGFL